MLDKPLFYSVQVKQAKIPINYNNIYVEYAIKVDEENKELFKTNVVNIASFRFSSKQMFLSSTTPKSINWTK